jgi:hypothetical protein
MKWNGIVSWPGTANIAAVLTAAKITQPGKSQRLASIPGQVIELRFPVAW